MPRLKDDGNGNLIISKWIAGYIITIFIALLGAISVWGATRNEVSTLKKGQEIIIVKLDELSKEVTKTYANYVNLEKRTDKLELKLLDK